MTANVGNWISQQCSTIGQSTLILTTPFDDTFLTFQNVLPAGLVYYSIIDGVNRESGIGTFNGVNQITRDTVTSTKSGASYSESGAPLSLSGIAIVSCTLNAKAFLETLHGRISWKNTWVDGAYELNDMVRDGSWTAIANKLTSDRPAPQNNGLPSPAPASDVLLASGSDSSVITMIHNYQITENGYLIALRVQVPFWDLDSVSRVTITNVSTSEVEVINNPILDNTKWVLLKASNTIYLAGAVVSVKFEFYNSTEVDNIIGSWTSVVGSGAPIAQRFTINDVNSPTVIEVDHTDLDNVSRATELDSVIINSIILISEEGDISRSVRLKVSAINTASTTSTQYTVSVIQSGSKAIRNNKVCTINIDRPLTKPSLYSVDVNYFGINQPDWATVSSQLYYDSTLQAGTTNSYGIEITYQKATTSPDWDLVALSGSSGGSGELNADLGLRDIIVTGISEGGTVTQALSTTVDITAGVGYVVDGYTDRENPSRLKVNWLAANSMTVNMVGTFGIVTLYIDITGTILQKEGFLSITERRTNIQLAFVYYRAGAISQIASGHLSLNEIGNTLHDLIYFLPITDRTTGLGLDGQSSALSLYAAAGELLSPGISHQNATSPNIFPLDAIGSSIIAAPFDVLFADGSVYLSNQTIVPEFYESAPNVATAIGGNDAVIHYCYRALDNTLLLQLGSKVYTNGQAARDSLGIDLNAYVKFIGSNTVLLTSQVYVSNGSPNFSNSTSAGVVNITGAGGGGGGGSSEIDLLPRDDGNFIVGDGTSWVAESGNTARTSLGLGTTDDVIHNNMTVNDIGANNIIANDVNVNGAFTSLGIDDNATNNAMIIDASENVGIGAAPTHKFDVNGGLDNIVANFSSTDAVSLIAFEDSGTTAPDTIYIGAVANQLLLAANDAAAGSISFQVGSIDAMTIDSSQNTAFTGNISIPYSKFLYLGDSNDLVISHSGTSSQILNYTGPFFIQSLANSELITYYTRDSGGVDRINMILGGVIPVVKIHANGILEAETVVGAFNIVNKLQLGGVDVNPAFLTGVSPAFTGNPTAPTQADGDNDTSIATTAFVQTAKNSSSSFQLLPVTTSSGNTYSVTISGMTVPVTNTIYKVMINSDNSATSTLNINGSGAVVITHQLKSSSLFAGDLKAGYVAELLYNGTLFFLLNPHPVSISFLPLFLNTSFNSQGSTYLKQQGEVYRVGNKVDFMLSCQINSVGSLAGDILLGNLPHSATSLAGFTGLKPSMSVGEFRLTNLAANQSISARMRYNSNAMDLFINSASGTSSPLTIAALSTSSEINVSGTFVATT